MAKKKSKKKKNIQSSFTAEYSNLITIFVGIFLLYSLNSSSMGILGTFIQNIFLGLFGKLSIAIPFIIIISGVLGFFEKNEYIYRLKSTKLYYVGVFFIFMFYGLINAKNLPIDSPTNSYVIKEVSKQAVSGEGCGLIATVITYYVTKIFGITGAWLVSIFALIITGLFTFNISLKDLIYTIKVKSKKDKDSNLTFKEKALNLKSAMVNMVTEEVDENTMMTKSGLRGKSKKEEINSDSIEDDENDKTIKIVGFNKAEDDYLEILEGTQSMPELEVLKELQKAKPSQKQEVTNQTNNSLEKTQPMDIKAESNYENYKKPSVELLNKIDPKTDDKSKKKVLKNASLLEKTLSDFGVEAKVNQVTVGPTITRYELQPSPGVKVSKIVNLTDDIALSLAAKSIRIEAPIPGKSAIGIEVPNEEAQMVTLREVLESDEFNKFDSPLAMGLGKDIAGKPIIADIGKMPHLLIAGSTGSGKSVCVNT
ncbi:MAG: DNA translocase FtsK 4TM domain-containing protein, partial [Paraclostridium sp.]